MGCTDQSGQAKRDTRAPDVRTNGRKTGIRQTTTRLSPHAQTNEIAAKLGDVVVSSEAEETNVSD